MSRGYVGDNQNLVTKFVQMVKIFGKKRNLFDIKSLKC